MDSLRQLAQLPMARPSLLGAILALVVGAGSFVYLSSADSGDASAGEDLERVAVLVAAQDIDLRNRLTTGDLVVQELPVEAVHPRAIRSLEAAVGKFALGNVTAGEQVLSSDIGDAPRGSSLAQLIPEGTRAIAIPVSAAITAGGLVVPGDRVDIVAIFEQDRAGRDGTVVVAADIEVLALSQSVLGEDIDTDEESGTNPRSVSNTVTIAVSLVDAQRITLADEFGSLRLFLRNPDDTGQPSQTTVDLDSVTGG